MLCQTRSNVREIITRAGHNGISKSELMKRFDIKDDDRKGINKLDTLVEAERKNGIIELIHDNRYRLYDQPTTENDREFS